MHSMGFCLAASTRTGFATDVCLGDADGRAVKHWHLAVALVCLGTGVAWSTWKWSMTTKDRDVLSYVDNGESGLLCIEVVCAELTRGERTKLMNALWASIGGPAYPIPKEHRNALEDATFQRLLDEADRWVSCKQALEGSMNVVTSTETCVRRCQR